MIGRLFKEPLVHFLVLALSIFALYGALNRNDEPRADAIVVTGAKIEQLAGLFVKTWQRPPSTSEVKGLIDDHVKEEILVREALALGLDKDDTVIRRRLRLKMEFLSQAQAESATPSEAELETFLKANPNRFRIDPMLSFRQVFLSPERRGEAVEQDVASVIDTLRAQPDTNPATLGDPTMLPAGLPPTHKAAIGQIFGAAFAEALAQTPPGKWAGPLKSSFGLHVVHVGESRPGRQATLSEVRDSAAREWTNERRQQAEDTQLAKAMERYRVRIETRADGAGSSGRSP